MPGRGVHPPEAMMLFIFPLFQISPLFPKFFSLISIFPFSSAKISDDFFLVIDYKFVISPLFSLFQYISPCFGKTCTFPPYFRKIQTLPPRLIQFTIFRLHLRFFLPILIMMHLCVMLYTYWTPLNTSLTHRPPVTCIKGGEFCILFVLLKLKKD